jgi:hypothetical protein
MTRSNSNCNKITKNVSEFERKHYQHSFLPQISSLLSRIMFSSQHSAEDDVFVFRRTHTPHSRTHAMQKSTAGRKADCACALHAGAGVEMIITFVNRGPWLANNLQKYFSCQKSSAESADYMRTHR